MNALYMSALLGGLLVGQQTIATSATETTSLSSMFDSLSHDFGNVPHGSQTSHRFTLTNRTNDELRLNSVSSSCKCATPKILKQVAKPGDTIIIEVTYNAQTFYGARSMVIHADFSFGQVDLQVQGFSRSDVSVEPGQVELGAVRPGTEQKRSVRLSYTGNQDWRVSEVIQGRWSTAKVVEKERSGGRVSYEVEMTLKKDAPRGILLDAVQLKTNDPSSPIVKVDLAAVVDGGLSASPSEALFGEIAVGKPAVQKLIVKNDRPFSVTSASANTKGLTVSATPGERTVHLVEVHFNPGAAGKVAETIQLITSVEGETLPVKVTAVAK